MTLSLRRKSRGVQLFERILSTHGRLFSVAETPSTSSKSAADDAAVDDAVDVAGTIDLDDPSKGTPSGWSLFNPEIRVRVCHRVQHPTEVVRDMMFDCSQYKRWWPKHWVYDIERCTPATVDSVIHFRSPVGHYSCRISEASQSDTGFVRLRQTYFDGILAGDMEWQITPLSPRACKLCYDAALKPVSFSAQLAAAVSSREYLASYFEPLVVSLKADLDQPATATGATTTTTTTTQPSK
jgi:hypothetical protein